MTDRSPRLAFVSLPACLDRTHLAARIRTWSVRIRAVPCVRSSAGPVLATLAGLRPGRQGSHAADGHDGLMYADRTSLPLTVHHTTDIAAYLNRVGSFLRRRPVEHSVLLSVAASHLGVQSAEGEEPNLWLWVEDGEAVVAAGHHTPPHGAYLSTGPAEAMRLTARACVSSVPRCEGWAGSRRRPRSSRPSGPGSVAARRASPWKWRSTPPTPSPCPPASPVACVRPPTATHRC